MVPAISLHTQSLQYACLSAFVVLCSTEVFLVPPELKDVAERQLQWTRASYHTGVITAVRHACLPAESW